MISGYQIRATLIEVVIVAGLGFLIAWLIWRPRPVPPETPAAAKVLPSGATELERRPENPMTAPIPADIKQAVTELGHGAKLERAIEIKIQPKQPPPPPPVPGAPAACSAPAPLACPPVTLDLGLVRLPDRTQRVVARSTDGTLLGGLDIPVQEPRIPWDPKWAAGAIYRPQDHAFGAFIERDLGPFRVGADLAQSHDGIGVAASLRVGVRF